MFRIHPRRFDRTPVAIGRIHREARRQRPIRPDNDAVLAGPAAPVIKLFVDELLHFGKALHGVDHVPSALLLFDEPVDDFLDRWMVFGADDRKSTRLNSSHLGISYAV